MAVPFESTGYDTTSTNPYTETAWAYAHPSIGTASYGVRNAYDWKVTAVVGADRTVSIAPGFGWGHGVTDQTTDNDTLQFDPVPSGSRWDLVVVRRDWTPTAGVTSFQKINGGPNKVLPDRQNRPGDIDDQPIALVQLTAGQTQPTAIVDLRCWSGDGGGLMANDTLARSYLLMPGTRIRIGGVDWLSNIDTNGSIVWDGVQGPYAMQTGTAKVSVSSGGTFGSTGITFAPGRFSKTPKVTTSMSTAPGGSQSFTPRAFNKSTNGATIGIYASPFSGPYAATAPNSFTVDVDWIAVQMTSLSADG